MKFLKGLTCLMVGVGAFAQGGPGNDEAIDHKATTKEIRYLAGARSPTMIMR